MKSFHNVESHRTLYGIGQFLLGMMLLFVCPAFGDGDSGRVKALMHAFVLEYAKMNPYTSTEEAFSSAKGKQVVGDSLSAINSKIQKDPPSELTQNSGFRITYKLLADHISKTKEIFDRGELEYARMRVNGIGNLCAGCHMQAPKISSYSAFEFITGKRSEETFNNANFLYTIRRYAEAQAIMDALIRKYPNSSLSSDQLNSLYRMKLGILVRIQRDPKAAIASLSEDLKNEKIPVDVRDNIKNWIESLKKWSVDAKNPATMSTPDLIKYVAANLPGNLNRKIAPSDPQLMNLLRMSGLLYDRLLKEPNSESTQQILFYLAKCERSLSPYYWYSMNEIYLLECIVKFPKASFSRKCYDAYKEGMNERYFGQALPDSVRTSLEALKAYL